LGGAADKRYSLGISVKHPRVYFVTLVVVSYLLAACYGYKTYMDHPEGLLLESPGPNGFSHNYTPAFPFAFGLALSGAILFLGVVALLAFFARTLSESAAFRFWSGYVAKCTLGAALLCLPGIFLIDWLWHVLHS
jgi:hypothetical protein